MQWYHRWLLIYLLSLTLELVDLDTKPTQLQFHIMTYYSLCQCCLCVSLYQTLYFKFNCSNETSSVGQSLHQICWILTFYLLLGRPHWSRKYCIVALEFAYVTVCLCLPLTWFLLSPPTVIHSPLTPAQVWQHSSNIYTVTQPHLNESQWITHFLMSSLSWKTQQSDLFIKFLYYHGLYSDMLMD